MRRPLNFLIGLALASGLPPVVSVGAAQEAAEEASDSTRPLGTPVPGKIVARIDNELRIEVDTDLPIRHGEIVTVKWDFNGRILDAGRADVATVDGRIVTAWITEGEPNEGMEATVWVVTPEEYYRAAEAIFKGEWPDDPASVRELRARAITLYLKAAWVPHDAARDRLREIRKEWGFFDMAPEVQYSLGTYYHHYLRDSDDTPERPEDAVEWYRLAGAQGHAAAIQSLGSLYYLGWGVEEDWERAHELYEKAIELGDIGAMYALAFHYASYAQVQGHDSQSDGIRWLTRAAEAGDCLASDALGELYMEGYRYPFEIEADEVDRERGLESLRGGARAGCISIRRRLTEMGESW